MRASIPLLLILGLTGAGACAADATFEGYAREPDSGALLYVETHFVWDAGTPRESRIVLYRCARGRQPFARKELSYAQERSAPSFDFEDARSGFREGLRREAGVAFVSASAGADGPRRSARLDARALVADAGFDEFVRANWDALERGDVLLAPFLVPSRLDRVQFRVRKQSTAQVGGAEASVIRLSVAGPLGWFVADIDVVYRNQDRRLASYSGVTNIRDANGRTLTARIDFPDEARHDDAPPAAQLRAQRLVSRCD
jgi:hypothetical protein